MYSPSSSAKAGVGVGVDFCSDFDGILNEPRAEGQADSQEPRPLPTGFLFGVPPNHPHSHPHYHLHNHPHLSADHVGRFGRDLQAALQALVAALAEPGAWTSQCLAQALSMLEAVRAQLLAIRPLAHAHPTASPRVKEAPPNMASLLLLGVPPAKANTPLHHYNDGQQGNDRPHQGVDARHPLEARGLFLRNDALLTGQMENMSIDVDEEEAEEEWMDI